MRIELPEHVKNIIEKLESNGFEAYAVGGCVRDTLLGRQPKDWDITTSARPKQIKDIFPRTIDTGIAHGTVTVMMEHVGYEVTTYRIDGEYEDARHPKEVTFTGSLIEDLKRRDFTINAMAYNDRDGLVDAFEGISDLKNGVIRCVGEAKDRFTEDALRMLRALRFAAQLGFSIEEKTAEAIFLLAPNIARVSAERIQTEIVKLITSAHPEQFLQVYHLGLSAVFLPEFDRMMETKQHSVHHEYSVGEHTIHAMEQVPADKILRLAVLFHDIAKPLCLTTDEKGQDHFHGHPQRGAEVTENILRRLKFDNDTIRRVCVLVKNHDDRPELSERNVRRAICRIGEDMMPLLFAVKEADALAQSMYRREEKLAYIKEYRTLFEEIVAKGQCVCKKDLAIGGRDLIALGMKPGKEMGKLLDCLFEQILDHPEWNNKEKLIELAHKFASSLI